LRIGGDDALDPRELAEPVVEAVIDSIVAADPQADIRIDLECPACAARWLAPFDVASYLWTELDALARRTLIQVHQLASAYGWTESEVLDLSPRRRAAYLEILGL
jgi:hypothetical protein